LKLRYDRYTGPALKVIKNYEATPSGAHTIIWDGCDEAGNILPYANYTFALWAYSLEKSAIIVVGGVPAVNNLQMTPLNFSPYRSQYSSSDAKNEGTITFELSRDANVTISVFDNSGNPVKVIANDAACSQGPNTFIWNGKDDAGNFLANGLYEILVQARSGTGYSDPLTLHSEIYY
jgi:flagellar hook assembly protein FlgD